MEVTDHGQRYDTPHKQTVLIRTVSELARIEGRCNMPGMGSDYIMQQVARGSRLRVIFFEKENNQLTVRYGYARGSPSRPHSIADQH